MERISAVDRSGAGLARGGGKMTVASAVSRLTGLARTTALTAVLGVGLVGDAYSAANSLPGMIYQLLLGGVLAAVMLPYLTRQRARGRRLDREQTQRLLTVAALALAAITLVALACVPLIVGALVSDPEQRRLASLFAYLLLPGIVGYGMTAVMTSVLNVRAVFAAPAWAPVINNIVLLVSISVFLLVPGPVTLTPTTMTVPQILVIGVGTLLGVVSQAAAVALALHRTGFRWKLRVRVIPHTWRPIRAGAPILGWVIVYVVAGQIGIVVAMKAALAREGFAAYLQADLLFQVAYGVLGVSLLTVLMPRIAQSISVGDVRAVISDLGRGARYSVVTLIPVTVALMVLAPSLTTVIFIGQVDVASARQIGTALALSAFGLVPFAMVMLQLRVFYAGNDTRTPAVINGVMVTVKIAVIVVAAHSLGGDAFFVTLCSAGSVSFVVGAVLGHVLLRKRYGLLGFHHVGETLGRIVAASVPAGGLALAVVLGIDGAVHQPRIAAVAALVAGTVAGGALLLWGCSLVGVPEVRRARVLLRP
ncbi:putative peptidoglycan lipid II flippase [Rhodococcus sp. 27YEA15]|uniref:murein biosynthesis integral membrane protein MurJ n=1 Tax=Rhodococcus sp. 27YEA15 TaxID=3156259 RepID=UPI003C7BBCCA